MATLRARRRIRSIAALISILALMTLTLGSALAHSRSGDGAGSWTPAVNLSIQNEVEANDPDSDGNSIDEAVDNDDPAEAATDENDQGDVNEDDQGENVDESDSGNDQSADEDDQGEDQNADENDGGEKATTSHVSTHKNKAGDGEHGGNDQGDDSGDDGEGGDD